MSRDWRPAVVDHAPSYDFNRYPEVGTLIAFDRKPYLVKDVQMQHEANWTEEAKEWGHEYPSLFAERLPRSFILAPVDGGKRRHILIQPWHYGWWDRLPEHYAICVQCGELAPCMEYTAEREARREMKRVEKLAATLPGHCWSCNEPITSRQASIGYTGPNVWYPLADSPRFHTRRKCLASAADYERAWVAADSARPRTWLTAFCEGTLVVHAGGETECFGAKDSDCPTPFARHRASTACYYQSHDCPRECPPGHSIRVPRPPLPAIWPSEQITAAVPS